MNIIGTKNQSRCVYCNSTSYGRGCAYGPNRIHVHVDDPKRCIYCGSLATGRGCPYNLIDKVHIHGISYNALMKESILKSTLVGYFLFKLLSENKNDENDDILDFYVNRLKKYIGKNKLSFLKMETIINKVNDSNISESSSSLNIELYENEIKTKNLIKENIKELRNIFSDGLQNGLKNKEIEKMILDAFLDL